MAVATLSVACAEGQLQPAEARVEIQASIEFGRVYVGASSARAVVVRSLGAAPLTIRAVSGGSDAVSIAFDPTQALIAAGSSLSIEVTWAPAVEGLLVGAITIETDLEGDAIHVVALRGVAATPPDCDDTNPCTADRFDFSTERCVHSPIPVACDDGSACTTGDRCDRGTCVGTALVCNDADPCTRDVCEPSRGCAFVPDSARCNDEDPCTVDLCGREGACSHAPAGDGARCGSLSCAAASLCVGGVCRAIDLAGASDGLPCDDGDRCTAQDACSGGACAGHPDPHPPVVTGVRRTFGSGYLLNASDGRTLVSGSEDSLDVFRIEAGALVHKATLAIAKSGRAYAVAVAADRFLVADFDGVRLIATDDVEHPVIRWLLSWDALGWPGPNFTGTPWDFVAHDGTVLAAFGGEDENAIRILRFDPLSESITTTSAIPTVASRLVELDVGAELMVVANEEITVYPTGGVRPLATIRALGGEVRGMAVDGQRIGFVVGGRVVVGDLVAAATTGVGCDPATSERCAAIDAGCGANVGLSPGVYQRCDASARCDDVDDGVCVGASGAACPGGTINVCATLVPASFRETDAWLRPGARDLFFEGDRVVIATNDGVYRLPAADTGPGDDELLSTAVGGRFMPSPGGFILVGAIARPFVARDNGYAEITGPWHGRFDAALRGGTGRLRLVRADRELELDEATKDLRAWHDDLKRGSGNAFALDDERCVPLGRMRQAVGAGRCGTEVGLYRSESAPAVASICRFDGGNVACTPETLWSQSVARDETGAPTGGTVRAWSLVDAAAEPSESTAGARGIAPLGLRATADPPGAILFSSVRIDGAASLGVGLVERRPSGVDLRAELVVPNASPYGTVTRAARDGRAVLLAHVGRVSLYELEPGSSTPPQLVSEVSLPPHASPELPTNEPAAILSMHGGRAWIAQGTWLAEVTYDVTALTLAFRGDVRLDATPVDLLALPDEAVVVTRAGVSFVEGACR